jgi:hypothetical protein
MLYLRLFHGRLDKNADMDDWGLDGPVLGPLRCVHVTYMCDIFIGDEFENLLVEGDLVVYKDVYYGDWTVITEEEANSIGFTIEEPLLRI